MSIEANRANGDEFLLGLSEHSEAAVARFQVELTGLAEKSYEDPAAPLLLEQLQNHLRHVSYSFRVARDSDDFPYELERTDAYPSGPTVQALARATRAWTFLDTDLQRAEYRELPTLPEAYFNEAKMAQQAVVDKLMSDPMAVYDDFRKRREEFGPEAPFPELEWTLKGLYYDLVTKSEVQEACDKSPILNALRYEVVDNMQTAIGEDAIGYRSALWRIEDAMAFFDLVVRINEPTSSALYHSARFEYNWYALIEDPELTVLPTMASVTAFDLLKFRSVPVGIIGVSTDTLTVDGFPQTPYEFFYHDVDHTRRMHEATKAAVEREGVTAEKFAQDATNLLHDVLLPAVDLTGITDEAEYDRRVAMRMILFEILHEDGLDPTADTIADAILRAPMERTPFEQVVEENGKQIVEHFMAPRATTLAHVFRKLAHTFYDNPDKRSKNLGSDFVRSRLAIARGAADLYRLVSDDPIDDEALLTTCQDMVSTDEGFTDAFIGNIAHDIARQAIGRRVLSMMVSRPLGVQAAVRQTRKLAEGSRIHSVFGYADLGYEDPSTLRQTIENDLSEMNPNEVVIVGGATPFGINEVLYSVAKEMNFRRLGIVASTAIRKDLECSENVDDIVVVKDMSWGGFKYDGYGNTGRGLLSPTTRVFVGASDSIAAYGGGNITAVTLEEMQRREKEWTFTPFDMNHRIADMMHAQQGHIDTVDYRGPAHVKWLELTKVIS